MEPATVIKTESLFRNPGYNIRYLYSILHTFITYKPQTLKIKTASGNWGGKAHVVAIANGKSFGNKIFIAPDSAPDDGLFNYFLGDDVSLLKFPLYFTKLKSKNKIEDFKIQIPSVQINFYR